MVWSRLSQWLRRVRHRRMVAAVRAREAALQSVSESELRRLSVALRAQMYDDSVDSRLVCEAFALMSEACRRTVGLRPYDVQLVAAAALCERCVVEMQTGEGKTLTAGLPLYYFGLRGEGAWLATSNDYLAERDSAWLRPAFALLGISVGVITASSPPARRRSAYHSDVTYGTGKEFGFDFLRDQMHAAEVGEEAALQSPGTVQRSPFSMLVDEADQVLLDDAGTPLIISAPPRKLSTSPAARFRWAAAYAEQFQLAEHYGYDEETRQIQLTTAGRKLVRELPQPAGLGALGWNHLYEDVERALLARRNFRPGVHYVVKDDEVLIVDEFTGRIADGRKWSKGLHQAVEAQEGVTIRDGGGTDARVTVQDFFRRFKHLAGMTGTAATSAREFASIYKMPTFVVPTHRPSQRRRLPTQVYTRADAKWRALAIDVAALSEAGRPVLIGTRSIGASETVSRYLQEAGVNHVVLNAREIAREAAIVAEAGIRGRVTVATNMAGRGTDIKLGAGVAELGGLHVILTELHEAARIDRQLVGRGARQGDPGSYQTFLSLEDELLKEALGIRRYEALLKRHAAEGKRLPQRWERFFSRAQQFVERRRFQLRKQLCLSEDRRVESARTLGLNPYLDLLS
ncbi:MAG: preprotein translocase subunit SecA [Pirellula sp.]|nr:preprotein translocase subunit SecA [Pirellula sp.]